jgi:hypothetical protein
MVGVSAVRALWGVLALCPGLALELRPVEEHSENESWKGHRYPDTPDMGLATEADTTSDHQLQLGLKERGLRVPLSWNKFPLWLNDRRLVAKFQRVYHGVHIFTVGVYVNKRCEVWGKKWDRSNFPKLLSLAVGNTTLRYEIVSKYLTRKMLAQDLVGKEITEHYKGPKAEKALMARLHERLMYKGPIFHIGAVLDFVLQDSQVWYLFNEQYIGKAGNHESSKAMLGAWVDDRSSEVFRNPLFSSLARGLDGHTSEMTARTGEETDTWPVAIVVLVSAMMALGCTAGCLGCYWRLRRIAEDDSFDSDYVEIAAS